MTALELRILGYGLALLAVIGISAWSAHRLTALHYESLMARDRAAQDAVIEQEQQHAIEVQRAQQAASAQAEKDYEALKASHDTLARQLADSVRRYAALRSQPMPPAASATGKSDATGAGTGGDQGTDRLPELVAEASGACLEDADRLTALQSYVRAVSELK